MKISNEDINFKVLNEEKEDEEEEIIQVNKMKEKNNFLGSISQKKINNIFSLEIPKNYKKIPEGMEFVFEDTPIKRQGEFSVKQKEKPSNYRSFIQKNTTNTEK